MTRKESKLELHEETDVFEGPELIPDESDYDLETVQRAIEALPDGFRTVLSLYLLEGYDHQEISDILGIAESTSKTQFKRAKERLRQIIKEMSNG